MGSQYYTRSTAGLPWRHLGSCLKSRTSYSGIQKKVLQ